MGLFDKKHCDVCGEKIGLLGNRKLEDGNLCKDCAKKLSPWFSDRRKSTVADIKAQLDYREENKAAVAAFNTTRTLGTGTKVLLDEDSGKFMVTSARDLAEANPDVISFSQVTGCHIDVDESKTELMREDSEGSSVSYNPPRYTYDYDFYVLISVNTPYFSEIRFKLNNFSIESPVQIRKGASLAQNTGSISFGGMSINMGGINTGTSGIPVEYAECEQLGEEIKAALSQARENVRQAVADAAAPKMAVTCPWCGATTIPDASGKCEYCGGALNG